MLDGGLASSSEISEDNGLAVVPVYTVSQSILVSSFATGPGLSDSAIAVSDAAPGASPCPDASLDANSGLDPDPEASPCPGPLRDLDEYHMAWCEPGTTLPLTHTLLTRF